MNMRPGLKLLPVILLLGIVAACNDAGPELQNEAAVRSFYAVLDANDFDAVDQLATSTCQLWTPGVPDPISMGDLKAGLPSYYEGFPDYNHTIDDLIATGEYVVVRSTARGTHEAEFAGIPATGNTIEYGQIAIFRLVDGLIVEAWIQEDGLTMMSQLGMNLAPPESGS